MTVNEPVWKVVRRVRGKLYSAFITKKKARLWGLMLKRYGRFWTKRPRFGGPLLAFDRANRAFAFAKVNDDEYEIWEAQAKLSMNSHYKRKDEMGGAWPPNTVFCDAIRLIRKA